MNDQERHMLVEADIGSGEKTPGQEDTEKILEQIGMKDEDKQHEAEKTVQEKGAKG